MKTTTLKIALLMGILILGYSCKKDDDTASKTNNDSLADGTYNASGTISFTAGGANYSCSILKVDVSSVSLTIQTSTTDILNTGMINISCYTATSAVTTGTYTADNSKNISAVSFLGKNSIDICSATATKTGSSCTVNLTTLTSTSINGTFTATVLPPLSGSSVAITNGVINCTIGSKQ